MRSREQLAIKPPQRTIGGQRHEGDALLAAHTTRVSAKVPSKVAAFGSWDGSPGCANEKGSFPPPAGAL